MTEPDDPHRDLAGVLHDVSNALTVVLGWAGEARAADSPDATAYALTIVEQYARIARDLARHAIGSPRVDEPKELGLLLDEVGRALVVEATRLQVRLVVEGSDVRAKVAGTLDLCQVLTNLVLNALAHAPKSTAVVVTAVAEEEHCTLIVSDEGPGIASDRRDSIFRGDSLRPGGTGVGLRHSRALACACGGDVELLPAETRGARFRVVWPRVDVLPRPPVSSRMLTGLVGMRVLVVEDDVAVTQLLELALGARGAYVRIAPSAEDFATAMTEGKYDAALMDLSPIRADASGAIGTFLSENPRALVILITGNAEALPGVLPEGSLTLVRKPFEIGEILRLLVPTRTE